MMTSSWSWSISCSFCLSYSDAHRPLTIFPKCDGFIWNCSCQRSFICKNHCLFNIHSFWHYNVTWKRAFLSMPAKGVHMIGWPRIQGLRFALSHHFCVFGFISPHLHWHSRIGWLVFLTIHIILTDLIQKFTLFSVLIRKICNLYPQRL